MRLPDATAAGQEKQHGAIFLAAAYGFVVLLAVVDFLTASDLSFLIFYLLPVAFVTFFVGRNAGFIISVAGVAAWFLVNMKDLLPGDGTIVPYWNLVEKLGFFFLMCWFLSTLKTRLAREKETERTDPLTGLPNRRRFQEDLDAEIRRSRRYGRHVTLVYVDLDGLADLDGRKGRREKDRLLRTVAGVTSACVRDVDIPARLGDNAFAVLMPETGPDAARAASGKFQKAVVDAMARNGWAVTVTMGVVTYLRPPLSADEMIGTADRIMYSGKEPGKNGASYRMFAPDPAGGSFVRPQSL